MSPAHRRFVVPAITVVVMLAVLLGLGTWQVYRLRWKTAILERIAQAEREPPVPLGLDPQPYTKVAVTGRFRFDLAARFGAEVRDTSSGPALGSYQIVPLERDGAPPILVNRGWFPPQRPTALDDPSGPVSVTGYIRPDERPHWFSAADDAPARQFYTLDTRAIAAALGLAAPMPFTLIALGPPLAPPLGPSSSTSYPIPAQHLPEPPNNHLSYAITWYGLALALVVIFIVWSRKPAST